MDRSNRLQANQERQSVGLAGAYDEVARLTAKDVMQYGVVSIDGREPVHKAVSILLEKDISGLPVTHQGSLAGMLSQKDLLKLVHEQEYLPGSTADYMTRDVVSVDVDETFPIICRQLAESPFRRVPVLLYQKRLAGMITRADLIRVYKDNFRPPEAGSHPRAGRELLAEDVMKHGLLTLTPDAPLYDAMDLIAGHHVTGLPVVDETMHLLGIITEKDVLGYCLHPFPPKTTVAAFMTTNVVAFDRQAGLDPICACLIEKDFHRVPIVDQGRLVGIISRSDILRSRVAVFKR